MKKQRPSKFREGTFARAEKSIPMPAAPNPMEASFK